MALTKLFEPDDSSSEGSGERLAPEASGPPFEQFTAAEHHGDALSLGKRIGRADAVEHDDTVQAAGQDHDQQTRKTAAGIAAGIFGLFLGGPILALIAGGGTVYAAGQARDSTAGDVARAVGDVALAARDKAKELDEKHNVVQKTKDAAGDVWESAKGLDAKHRYMEKIRNALAVAYERAVPFKEEHHVFANR